MSESETSETEISLDHALKMLVMLYAYRGGDNPIINKWAQKYEYHCSIAIAHEEGFTTGITPAGESFVREAITNLTNFLQVTPRELLGLVASELILNADEDGIDRYYV